MSKDFTPHPYQEDALDHLYRVRRGGLWMVMGGGKTATVLTALDRLNFVEDVFPALVLGPKRVVRSVWAQEAAKWNHTKHLRVSVITGTPMQRRRAIAAEADIYCTNYENLTWLMGELGDEWPYHTVVADEVPKLKSFRIRQGGKRAHSLGKVAHTKVKRFIGLTGTPAPNGLKDQWGQTWFYDKGERLGATFTAFENRWFQKGHNGFGLEPRAHAQEEIHAKLKDICLTVRGLPVDEPIFNDILVDVPPSVRQLYKALEESMFAELENDRTVSAVHAAARTNKLCQLANGAIYADKDHWDTKWEPIHGAKLDALESIVEEANGMPVLVGYQFISDRVRILERFPQARFLDDDPDTLVRWNEGRIPMLVCHPASAGHGLNLQDGSNILALFGLGWNLEHYLQIIERIGPTRQKQSGYDRPVVVHRILLKDSVDEMQLKRMETKRSVQDILLEAMEKPR